MDVAVSEGLAGRRGPIPAPARTWPARPASTCGGRSLAGMGMTEKQGGSDVRAATTAATPNGDGTWSLRGHKWFTSAPMCDLFLVFAQAVAGPGGGGLSCFLVPRVLPDGTRNAFRIQRLKDKLGNRSNASCEPEFDGTVAWLVGEQGRGATCSPTCSLRAQRRPR
jgi:alkylation response protein AidB-like acyl-CoA dehydrogenase